MTKYKATITKHDYSINKVEYFVIRLVEVPKVQISRSTREMNYKFFSPSKPIIKVVFKGQSLFEIIKNRNAQDLPIFIKGEHIHIDTTFAYTPHTRDVSGKLVPIQCTTFDVNSGSYIKKPLTINKIDLFIEESNLIDKDRIIQTEIKKKKKYKQ
jgi:hypothetical protein